MNTVKSVYSLPKKLKLGKKLNTKDLPKNRLIIFKDEINYKRLLTKTIKYIYLNYSINDFIKLLVINDNQNIFTKKEKEELKKITEKQYSNE